MAIIKPNNNTISAITALPAAISTGKVLQIVNAVQGTEATSSSSTYSDTGLSATITPSSSSNKVLVLVSQNSTRKGTNNTWCQYKLLRGSTDIVADFETRGAMNDTTSNNWDGGNSVSYLDSPATTAATTYKTQFKSGNNNAYVNAQESGSKSTITLLEIEA
jgi:hypothetical protein